MAAQEGVHRSLEARGVDVPFQIEGELHQIDVRSRVVVHGVEQQPLLKRSQRQDVDGAGNLAPTEAASSGVRATSAAGAGAGPPAAAVAGDGTKVGQRGGRLVLEDLAGGEHQPFPAGAAHQLHGQDAVPAQREEPFVDTCP